MFRSQRGPDPFVGEGRLESLLHGPFRRFVLSLPLSPPSAFYDSFLFIVEPESLVHNGPVRGMRASNRCSSHPLGPSIRVSLLLSSLPPVERRRENQVSRRRERETDGRIEMKNRRCPLLPSLFFVKSFFWLTVTNERCLSFNWISIQRPFLSAPLPISPLSWIAIDGSRIVSRYHSFKLPANQQQSDFFPRWKGIIGGG